MVAPTTPRGMVTAKGQPWTPLPRATVRAALAGAKCPFMAASVAVGHLAAGLASMFVGFILGGEKGKNKKVFLN